MTKAVALFSGGLDSQLAVRLIQDQGIEVIGVYFVSPFFGKSPWLEPAQAQLKIQIHLINFGPEYIEMLKNPLYGYGKNLNPCIDCHGMMLNRAGQYMEQIGADFLITGEVLGQRPKSQRLDALRIVDKLSGYPGLVLRPLSAKLLPPTLPEINGLVDRERLLAISGRSRKAQLELAQKFGMHDYPAPAGGCLLTVPSFADRLRLLWQFNPEALNPDFELLKVGRHFFGPEQFYLIVGRKEAENQVLQELAAEDDILFKVTTHPGPLALLRRPPGLTGLDEFPTPAVLETAAGITARYSDAKVEPSVEVKFWHPNQEPKLIQAIPQEANWDN